MARYVADFGWQCSGSVAVIQGLRDSADDVLPGRSYPLFDLDPLFVQSVTVAR